MNKNNNLENSLNKIFSSTSYKMVDVSSKEVTHRKALAVGEIILSSEVIEMIKNKKCPKVTLLLLQKFLESTELKRRVN